MWINVAFILDETLAKKSIVGDISINALLTWKFQRSLMKAHITCNTSVGLVLRMFECTFILSQHRVISLQVLLLSSVWVQMHWRVTPHIRRLDHLFFKTFFQQSLAVLLQILPFLLNTLFGQNCVFYMWQIRKNLSSCHHIFFFFSTPWAKLFVCSCSPFKIFSQGRKLTPARIKNLTFPLHPFFFFLFSSLSTNLVPQLWFYIIKKNHTNDLLTLIKFCSTYIHLFYTYFV